MHLCVEISIIFVATTSIAVAGVLSDWRVHHNVPEVLDYFATRASAFVCRKEVSPVTADSKKGK